MIPESFAGYRFAPLPAGPFDWSSGPVVLFDPATGLPVAVARPIAAPPLFSVVAGPWRASPPPSVSAEPPIAALEPVVQVLPTKVDPPPADPPDDVRPVVLIAAEPAPPSGPPRNLGAATPVYDHDLIAAIWRDLSPTNAAAVGDEYCRRVGITPSPTLVAVHRPADVPPPPTGRPAEWVKVEKPPAPADERREKLAALWEEMPHAAPAKIAVEMLARHGMRVGTATAGLSRPRPDGATGYMGLSAADRALLAELWRVEPTPAAAQVRAAFLSSTGRDVSAPTVVKYRPDGVTPRAGGWAKPKPAPPKAEATPAPKTPAPVPPPKPTPEPAPAPPAPSPLKVHRPAPAPPPASKPDPPRVGLDRLGPALPTLRHSEPTDQSGPLTAGQVEILERIWVTTPGLTPLQVATHFGAQTKRIISAQLAEKFRPAAGPLQRKTSHSS